MTIWNVLKQSRAVTHRLSSHFVTGFVVHQVIRQLEPRFSLSIPTGQWDRQSSLTSPHLGRKKMATMPWSCHDHHTMIMAKHGHDQAMMTAMFLGMVIMIHSMIIPWLRCLPWFTPWSSYDYDVLHDSYHDHSMIIICFPCFSIEKMDC